MDLYDQTAYELSRRLTLRYSTSFGLSSWLFARDIRPHIYAVYGLARIADEIVDTYDGESAAEMLDDLEHHTERSMEIGYSPNPLVHAFALSARKYGIGTDLTRAFFKSMRIDLSPQTYDDILYREYIYGSAEVIGLMCVRVFVGGDDARYEKLAEGARSLGAAYQKVNFLRDVRDDYARLGRVYFPGVMFETFTGEQKQEIEADIEQDFINAKQAINDLPRGAKAAVLVSYEYYHTLFKKIKRADVLTIKTTRMRIWNGYKLLLLCKRLIIR